MDQSNSDQSRRFAGEIPIPWGIMDFYSRDQDPWHPPGIITPLQKQSGAGGFQSTGPSFQGFRSTHQPSESDLNDDSGYGGSNRPPYSIENTSVYGDDRNPEAQLAAHRIETLQIHTDASRETQLQQWPQPRRSTNLTNLTAIPGSRDNQHFCSECNVSFRTRSEYKKHMLRHRKPFTCDVSNCTRRKEGFGTKNDLDRHKRSVHSDLSVSGPRYVCRMGQCGSKEPAKIWPRADNFRQHLHRVHKVEIKAEDDLDPYIYHQLQDQVPLRQELQGVGGSILATEPGALNYQPSGALSFDQPFPGPQVVGARPRSGFSDIQEALSLLPRTTNDGTSSLAPVQEDEEVFIEPGILNGTGPHSTQSSPALGDDLLSLPQLSQQSSSPNNEDVLLAGNASMEQNDTELSIPVPSSQGVDEPQIEDNGSDCPSDSDSDSSEPESSDVGMVDADQTDSTSSSISEPLALLSGLSKDDPKVLDFLRALPKEVLESVLKSDSNGPSSDGSQTKPPKSRNQHICSVCSKPFNRPCELKKHKKRHEKPYGCTFINCHKIFGSKNDWKRHESSQHWHLETWQCDCRKDDKNCDKRFMRRESFKHHLQRDHSMDDSRSIDDKLETCRIGRHCESRYWCGFCERTIEVGAEKVNAWTMRCNHIDDHFCGRNGQAQKNIKQWVHPVQPEDQHDDSIAQDRSSTRGASAKRKLGNTIDQMARKRRREAVTYMWQCCGCNNMYNLRTVTQCLECSHAKCDAFCEVDMIFMETKRMSE